MKALSLCVLLALSITVYGQEPGAAPRGPASGEAQPDTSGLRLQQMLHRASELQRAGQPEQAATVLRQAQWERQGLLNRLDALQAEAERIRQIIGPQQQILVHLQVMEVSLTKLKKLGFDMTKLQGKAVTAAGDVQKEGAPGGFSVSVINDGSEVYGIFESLRKDNLAKVLAEPTLVTISGHPATFHAGGEVAIPTPQKDGSMRTEQQPYGTEVELKPELLGNRHVRLAIRCRLSELDYANATRVGKDVVPNIRAREFTTVTESQSGQTIVLSGLTEIRVETEARGLPWVSEIPYAGAAFRSVKETRNDVATFVLVRPELVEPSAAPAQAVNIPPTTVIPAPIVHTYATPGHAGNVAPTATTRPGDNGGRR